MSETISTCERWAMAVAILNGSSIAEIATQHALTDAQVRTIVWGELETCHPSVYAEGAGEGTPTLAYLRHHKSKFIERGQVQPFNKPEIVEVMGALKTLQHCGFRVEPSSSRAMAFMEKTTVIGNPTSRAK